MKNSLLFLLMLVSVQVVAQDRYIIRLKDKHNSPFSFSNPSEYLSQKAISRRVAMGIAIDSADLPINPSYRSSIAGTGARILNQSKWFNTVTVEADTNEIIAVGQFNFVDGYQKVFGSNIPKGVNSISSNKFSKDYETVEVPQPSIQSNYGGADNQTKMIEADALHTAGYKGESIIIAVIDAGFRGTDIHKAFDSLRNSNRILGTWNFTDNSSFVYDYSNHGSMVLSCMAANVPDSMVGTAPQASYYLLRSEEEATEYIVEEYNWAAAAEYADSVGADIINSSLGYTQYDAASQSHTYNDMDGNTTPVTRAANIASDKGVLVVNSAGNSGSDTWFYIGAPADGDKVFTVGAVDPQKSIGFFSSNGPTSAGDIKPDVVGQGAPAYIARMNTGSYAFGNGTSFSSPVIAGFSACALQLLKTTRPEATPALLKSWIKTYSDRNGFQNNQYGWGIPSGLKLLQFSGITSTKNTDLQVYPNPVQSELLIDLGSSEIYTIRIIDLYGKTLVEKQEFLPGVGSAIEVPYDLSAGLYLLQVQSKSNSYQGKFIKE